MAATLALGNTAGLQISWQDALGAIAHLLGPSDQALDIRSGTGQGLDLLAGVQGQARLEAGDGVGASNGADVVIRSGDGAFGGSGNSGDVNLEVATTDGGITGDINIGLFRALNVSIGNAFGANAMFLAAGSGGITFTGNTIFVDPVGLPSFTVAGVPSATTVGRMIFVSNEVGGAVPAFSDGTAWRRVTDRAIVSV